MKYEISDLIELLQYAGASGRQCAPQLLAAAADEIRQLWEAHQAIVRKYELIMQGPPEWTTFAPDDPRLLFAREAWFGAAQISRKALNAT